MAKATERGAKAESVEATECGIHELAELVIELTGSKSQVVYRDLPADDPIRRQPDISVAKEKLDWQPKIGVREGLQRTIAWFRSIKLSNFRPPTPNF